MSLCEQHLGQQQKAAAAAAVKPEPETPPKASTPGPGLLRRPKEPNHPPPGWVPQPKTPPMEAPTATKVCPPPPPPPVPVAPCPTARPAAAPEQTDMSAEQQSDLLKQQACRTGVPCSRNRSKDRCCSIEPYRMVATAAGTHEGAGDSFLDTAGAAEDELCASATKAV